MRKTMMNMSGPGRFQAVINHPQVSASNGYVGNLGRMVKINDAKKPRISTIVAACPTLFTNLNILREFNQAPGM